MVKIILKPDQKDRGEIRRVATIPQGVKQKNFKFKIEMFFLSCNESQLSIKATFGLKHPS